jgi:hypothetical protein
MVVEKKMEDGPRRLGIFEQGSLEREHMDSWQELVGNLFGFLCLGEAWALCIWFWLK